MPKQQIAKNAKTASSIRSCVIKNAKTANLNCGLRNSETTLAIAFLKMAFAETASRIRNYGLKNSESAYVIAIKRNFKMHSQLQSQKSP